MRPGKIICYAFLVSATMIVAGFTSLVHGQNKVTKQFSLQIITTDKDSVFRLQDLHLQTAFPDQQQCMEYINRLPALLQQQGYLSASVDSFSVNADSAMIVLYVGKLYKDLQITVTGIEKKALDESGINTKLLSNTSFDFKKTEMLKERLLNFYENNGYPFAAVSLDSFRFTGKGLHALLKVNKGPLYHIDSIRIFGKVNMKPAFLQQYLSIPAGSIYSKEKLNQVSKRLLELPYVQEVQPADMLMLGTGAVLNVYLQNKKNSQVNFLIGFLPSNTETKKIQLTGDVNLHLKNALGNGEMILLNWQQLQIKSPKLVIGYQQPYIFKTPFGIDFSFNLFKKDSSFLQINAQLGVQYLLSAKQSGKIFIQTQNSFLLGGGVDTEQIKLTRQLPPNIDVKGVNIGVEYTWNNTNYRNNPKAGNEVSLSVAVGTKKISKSSEITSLYDPAFNYASLYDSVKLKTYQLRTRLMAAHYFPAGKASTFKLMLNAGIFNSQSIFRNELFQIGGNNLLRGFDEESIYATQYGVLTAEYRLFVGINSYLFGFIDAGAVKNKYQLVNSNNHFTSAGLGLVFERKSGLINVSLAVGKRGDTNFNFREAAKIHFGYISYF